MSRPYTAGATSPPEWIVMMEDDFRRWGGDLRRGNLFQGLARHTGAARINGFSARKLRHFVGIGPWLLPVPMPDMLVSRRGRRPRLASSEQLRPDMVRLARRVVDPVAVAVYDDPIAQTAALGITMAPEREFYFRRRRAANLGTFRWLVVPSATFAELVGLDPDRVIVAGNGTDATHITPGPWPEQPTVGMVSGAAPGRGIEALIEASTEIRRRIPELRLDLWLVATGPASEEYLESLKDRSRQDSWISVESVPYRELAAALARATVLTIPHPPSDYMDVALPVKLYDSMAAGRPLVVTPRRETRAVVERYGTGVVAHDDSVAALAAALESLLVDESRTRTMGRAAREAAERYFDWPVVGDRIASEILSREGLAAG